MTEHSHITVKELTLFRVRTMAKWVGWGALGVTALLFIIGLAFWRFGQLPQISLVNTLTLPLLYWVFARGIGVAVEWRQYIASGVTRRTHATSTLLTLLATAAMMTLCLAVMFFVEYQLSFPLDWMASFPDPNLFGNGSQVHLVILQYMILLSSHAVAGWLTGIAFQRFHAWALLLLPAVIAVLIATQAASGGGGASASIKAQLALQPHVLSAIVIGVGGLALMYVAGRRLMQDIPMAPKTA